MMIKCPKCETSKEKSKFYLRNDSKCNRKNPYHSYCKECLNRIQMRRWKQRKIDAINLKGGKCQDCNGVFPSCVYQFHHLNPQEKDFNWGHGRLKKWETIVKELEKCILLCANCHFIRHSKDISDYD